MEPKPTIEPRDPVAYPRYPRRPRGATHPRIEAVPEPPEHKQPQPPSQN